ncbi:MAG: cell division protein ZipA [Pseudomonadota bacterium]|nr:cell division protein ZipA [Pseudomonadota bacterium]
MDDLRLILLLIGAGIILVVYAWSRVQVRPRKRSATRTPSLNSHSADDLDASDIEQELQRMEQLVMERDDEPVAQDPERLLIVSVLAAQGGHFSGRALVNGFEHNKLRFGEHEIYYRMTTQSGKERPVFGVANVLKPGTFPVSDMENFTTRGLTLFLQLPGPLDGVEAFDDFVHTAERLAVELGGELRDEQHRLLTHQALMQVRERVVEDRLHRKAAL